MYFCSTLPPDVLRSTGARAGPAGLKHAGGKARRVESGISSDRDLGRDWARSLLGPDRPSSVMPMYDVWNLHMKLILERINRRYLQPPNRFLVATAGLPDRAR